MRKFICHLFILTAVVHSTCWGDIGSSANVMRAKKLLSSIDGKSEELLKFLNVPGAAIGVIVEGEVVYCKAFGKRDILNDLPMTTKTIMPVGSATKGFTSFLIGQLVDEGVLHWDDPIVEHVPKFKLIDPYTTYSVTIRDYLTHVSGFSRHDGSWYGGDIPRDEIIHRMRHHKQAFSLRERFCYGNLGYTVAAHAAEKATEKSWEELLQERILNPLEMTNTTSCIKELQASEDYSRGYRDSKIGIVQFPYLNPYTVGPAGGLNSNVEDMLKWTALLLKRGDNLMQSDTFSEMVKPQVVSNVLLNGRYGVEDLVLMETYGLGWFVLSYRHHEAILHGGNIGGFSAAVFFLPKEDFGIVVLTNKHYTPLPYVLSCEIADILLEITPTNWIERFKQFGSPEANDYFKDANHKIAGKVDGTSPSHSMKDFTGTYENPGYGTFEFDLKEDRLIGKYNNLNILFDHWHYDTFEISKESQLAEIEGLKIAFRHNFFGEIDSVVIPFEKEVDNIVFTKKKDERLFQEDYLKRFLGTYNYLGFAFVVEREGDSLNVKALGQPPFVLVPEKDGLFSVTGYDKYTVQFFFNDDESVNGVHLIQPNNTTFTAYKNVES